MAKAKSKAKAKTPATPSANPLAEVRDCNEQLAADITNLGATGSSRKGKRSSSSDAQKENLKEWLSALFMNLKDFLGLGYRRKFTNKALMETWSSFHLPIEALAGRGTNEMFDGHFLAARMLLYVMAAFLRERSLERRFDTSTAHQKLVKERSAFLFDMDEKLLIQLREVYRSSNGTDPFNWVLSEYPVQKKHTEDQVEADKRNQAWASAVSLKELEELGAIEGRKFWRRREGDTKPCPRHPKATLIRYASNPNLNADMAGEDEEQDDREPQSPGGEDNVLPGGEFDAASVQAPGEVDAPGSEERNPRRFIVFQVIGSDGPIRENYCYRVVDEDGDESHRWKDIFIRSKQFIIDARSVARWRQLRDESYHCRLVLLRKVPPELREMIMGYVERPIRPKYVADLDLADIYQPFPDAQLKPPAAYTKSKSKTQGSEAFIPFYTIWNLPLRAFMTIHATLNKGGKETKHRPCKYLGCRGIHADDTWSTRCMTDEALRHAVEGLVKERCGQQTTSVGLAPVEPVITTKRVAEERAQAWHEKEVREDLQDELATQMQIGIGGLVDAMVHGRSLIAKHHSGSEQVQGSWMLGRTREEQNNAAEAFIDEHRRSLGRAGGCALC